MKLSSFLVSAVPVDWDGGIDGGGLRRDDEQKAIKTKRVRQLETVVDL